VRKARRREIAALLSAAVLSLLISSALAAIATYLCFFGSGARSIRVPLDRPRALGAGTDVVFYQKKKALDKNKGPPTGGPFHFADRLVIAQRERGTEG
jgi:hypothetical protein